MIYDFVQSVNTVCVCVYYLLPCALAVYISSPESGPQNLLHHNAHHVFAILVKCILKVRGPKKFSRFNPQRARWEQARLCEAGRGPAGAAPARELPPLARSTRCCSGPQRALPS